MLALAIALTLGALCGYGIVPAQMLDRAAVRTASRVGWTLR